MADVLVSKTIHSKAPRVPFVSIGEDILPNNYELSVVLIADKLGKKLNNEHKNHNYPTNVLSFPLSEQSGEIFINVRKAAREAHKFDHTTTEHIKYLLIHGCLHLCGHDHGNQMELLEQKYLKKFSQ